MKKPKTENLKLLELARHEKPRPLPPSSKNPVFEKMVRDFAILTVKAEYLTIEQGANLLDEMEPGSGEIYREKARLARSLLNLS